MIGLSVNGNWPVELDGLCMEVMLKNYKAPSDFPFTDNHIRLHLPAYAMYNCEPNIDQVSHLIEAYGASIVVAHPCDSCYTDTYKVRVLKFARQLEEIGVRLEIENGVPVEKRHCFEAYSNPAELGNFIRSLDSNVGMVLDIGKAALHYALHDQFDKNQIEIVMEEYEDIIKSYHLCEKQFFGGADAVVGIQNDGIIGTKELLPYMNGTLIIEANQPIEEAYEDAKWLKQSYFAQENQQEHTR